jgi:hypothetical protein
MSLGLTHGTLSGRLPSSTANPASISHGSLTLVGRYRPPTSTSPSGVGDTSPFTSGESPTAVLPVSATRMGAPSGAQSAPASSPAPLIFSSSVEPSPSTPPPPDSASPDAESVRVAPRRPAPTTS